MNIAPCIKLKGLYGYHLGAAFYPNISPGLNINIFPADPGFDHFDGRLGGFINA
jgi:hypothetical protein